MGDNFSQILGFLIYFLPIALGVLVIGFSLVLGVWGVIDMNNLRNMDGDIKRGFKIWSQPLTMEQLRYLKQLSGNVIEELHTTRQPSFIQKNNDQILIFANNQTLRNTIPYLGYVNLSSPNPDLEFRSSLPIHLLLIVFALSVFLFPFVVIMFIIFFSTQKQSIEDFLQKKIKENI